MLPCFTAMLPVRRQWATGWWCNSTALSCSRCRLGSPDLSFGTFNAPCQPEWFVQEHRPGAHLIGLFFGNDSALKELGTALPALCVLSFAESRARFASACDCARIAREIRLRLVSAPSKVGIDVEKQIAFLDEVALVERYLFQLSAHLRFHGNVNTLPHCRSLQC